MKHSETNAEKRISLEIQLNRHVFSTCFTLGLRVGIDFLCAESGPAQCPCTRHRKAEPVSNDTDAVAKDPHACKRYRSILRELWEPHAPRPSWSSAVKRAVSASPDMTHPP